MLVPILIVVGAMVAFVLLFAYQHRRIRLVNAMKADGFAPHEIKRAMYLRAHRDDEGMERHCQAIAERTNRPMSRDWTKADSYR